MDENHESFEALEAETRKRDRDDDDDEDEDEDEEFDGDDDDDDEHKQLSEFESSLAPIEAELRVSQSETLSVPSSLQLSQSDLQSDFGTSSHHLSEVPVDYTLEPHEPSEFKEALVGVTSQVAQPHMQNLLQLHVCPTSSTELSPTSVTQFITSAPSPTLPEQRLSHVAKGNGTCVPEVDKQKFSDPKSVSCALIVKTPSTDGYNWRKYGQKQVKSPQGSRSYYRCTYSECCAKKIECCDHSHCVIEIIYKGRHNHEPPQKIKCSRESRLAQSFVPDVHPIRMLSNIDSSTFPKEPMQDTPPIRETERQNSSGDGDAQINVKEEHLGESEPKRRERKSGSAFSGSVFKPNKKQKFIVHAAGDVGISGDGYRWRKYGQKMVKGKPHPRNYYRCTSAGCPVRKHIERTVDSTSAVIITYKGVHDHDMPVPKKRHGPPSAPLVAAAAPASMNNLQIKKTEAFQDQISATQWSVDTEGELTGEALDLGGEKAMESARTLLSIGFEIKPC